MRKAFYATMLSVLVSCPGRASDQPRDGHGFELPSDELGDVFSDARDFARAQGSILPPASVDSRPIQALFDGLYKGGSVVTVPGGVLHIYFQSTVLDEFGRREDINAFVVERKDESEEAVDEPVHATDLTLKHSFFPDMQVCVQIRNVDQRGSGQIERSYYTVSFDGRLKSVEHIVVPLTLGFVDRGRVMSSAASPSNEAVQRQWNNLAKKLLTMGVSS